jgi:hypothetical protein
MAKYKTAHIEPKHVRWFVHGAVHDYCNQTHALAPHEHQKRADYVERTLEVVWGYLRGTKTLDGSCSDLQCNVALEAFKVFKPEPLTAEDMYEGVPGSGT